MVPQCKNHNKQDTCLHLIEIKKKRQIRKQREGFITVMQRGQDRGMNEEIEKEKII